MVGSLWKRLAVWPPFQRALGIAFAEYFRLVWKSTRIVIEPADIFERADKAAPIILGMWHGQHFLVPLIKSDRPAKVLISHHRDGEINAIAAQRLGVGLIRGSGAHGVDVRRKGGIQAFFDMQLALEQGCNVALTADVPKVSRVAGRGIASLAAASRRPIFVVAVATRNRIVFEHSWDRAALNLPFGRGAVVGFGPIEPPATTENADIEATRQEVEAALNRVTARAYQLVDGPRTG